MTLRQLFLDHFVETYHVLEGVLGPNGLERPIEKLFLAAERALPKEADPDAWFRRALVRSARRALYLQRLGGRATEGLGALPAPGRTPALAAILLRERWQKPEIAAALRLSPDELETHLSAAPELRPQAEPPAGLHRTLWDRIDEAASTRQSGDFSPLVSTKLLLGSVLAAALLLSGWMLTHRSPAVALLAGRVSALSTPPSAITEAGQPLPTEQWLRVDQGAVLTFHGTRLDARAGSLIWLPPTAGQPILLERGELRLFSKDPVSVSTHQATARAESATLRIIARPGTTAFDAEHGTATLWPEHGEGELNLNEGERRVLSDESNEPRADARP